MQRPIRAIVYGFAIWWIWFLILGITRLLPESVTASPAYPSIRLLALVVVVVFFAVDYLRRIREGSVWEGLAVGIVWAILTVANDLGHFLVMGEGVDIVAYLTVFAPLYAFIPIVTVLVVGRLAARTESPGPA